MKNHHPKAFLRFTLTLAMLSGIVLAQTNAQGTFPNPPFTPPKGHPRVYFTSKDIPGIRANLQKPQNLAAFQVFLKNLETGTDGIRPKASGNAGNMSSIVLGIIESYAFDYAIRGNEASGGKAITAMRNYLKTAEYPNKDYNNTGQTVFTASAVYDWCYPLLSDEDKTELIAGTLKTAAKMEIGYPPLNQGAVTGHGPEGQLQRDIMSAAIAMHDERPDIFQVAAGRFFDQFIDPKLFMYPSRMHSQGSHYMSYRFQWEMLATWLFARMGLPDVFGKDQRYIMYWPLYARRPDGSMLRDGDTHIDNKSLSIYYNGPNRAMFLSANYFNDPWQKMEAMRERPGMDPTSPSGNQSLAAIEILVFNNPDLSPRPLSELPNTMYYPSPKGSMTTRTSWEDGVDSPAVVAEFKINEWHFANHQHLDAGSFQLYYKGMLATDSGYYQSALNVTDTSANEGSTGYGSLYDVNYNKRSIAHNTISVYDPNEKFYTVRWARFPMANDGGQRFPNAGIEPQLQSVIDEPANGYKIASILAHAYGSDEIRPNYSYLKGDLTKAYSAKIEAYERSFMFLDLKNKQNPAALIVFDRVISANKDFRKSWILHGLEEPAITGNQTVFKDTRPGYNGKLTVDTILPAADDTTITSIGGPGKENWVNGVEYKAKLTTGTANEGGGWRIEVSPKTARQTDYFLHVLQPGDQKPGTVALLSQPIDSPSHTGVQLANRVVLFGKNGIRARKPVQFSFKAPASTVAASTAAAASPASFDIMVDDLEAGTWSMERSGAKASTISVSPDSGLAVFNGPAGTYKLTFVKASTAPKSRPGPIKTAVAATAPVSLPVAIRVNEQFIYSETPATMAGETVMVPCTAVIAKLGTAATLQTSGTTSTIVHGGKSYRFANGSKSVTITTVSPEATKTLEMDAPAIQKTGEVLVPASFLAQTNIATNTWYPLVRIINFVPAPPIAEAGTIGIVGFLESSHYEDTVGTRAYDGKIDTWWSAAGYEGEWITFDLGIPQVLKGTSIIWNKGAQRKAIFDVVVSDDNATWSPVFSGKSSGTSAGYENFDFPAGTKARYVRINGKGNSVSNWNAIIEIKFY